MDFDRKLRKCIAWLNNEGGFQNQINYQKVAKVAYGNSDYVFTILKQLEDKKDEVKDATAYVTSALRRTSSQALPYGYAPSPVADISGDRQLSKRIRELNTTGGFENQINYSKVMESAQGLPSSQVYQILENLESKRGSVKDPTAFVAAGCRRLGGGYSPMAYGAPMGYGSPPAEQWLQAPASMAMPQSMLFDEEADRKLRKRIAQLNNEGGFENRINYQKVLEVAQYVSIHVTMKALKQLEEKKNDVKDPTAYVTSTLRKAASDNLQAPEVDASDNPDRQVRRRIMWLNNEGGFGNSINYTKVSEAIEAAGDVGLGDVIQVLDGLQEKMATVKDPTAFVTSGIRRIGQKPGGAVKKPFGVMRTIVKKESGLH